MSVEEVSSRLKAIEADATVAESQQRLQDCERLYSQAQELAPERPFYHHKLGYLAYLRGDWAAAADRHRQVIRLAPNWPEGYRHLAACLHELRRLEEAVVAAERACALNPSDAHLWGALGKIARSACRPDIAGPAMERALALLPDDPRLIYSNGLHLLSVGRWREGWKAFEKRFEGSDRAGRDVRPHRLPVWTGQAVPHGSALVVVHEQGLGDTLMMLRFHRQLQRKFARVIYDMPETLRGLVAASCAGAEIHAGGAIAPKGQQLWQVSCMSLPACLDADAPSLDRFPYLRADAAIAAEWRARMAPAAGRPRVGLLWHAGKVSKMPGRDVAPDMLSPLASTPAIVWYSLSNQPLPPVLSAWVADSHQLQWNMHETAALISNLDLVITVDTSIAHLAAALGRTVWLLHRYDCEWRWGTPENPSPWYPGVRIFRQRVIDDWSPVIAEMAAALPAYVEGWGRRVQAERLHNEGVAAHQQGDIPRAVDLIRQAIDLAPDQGTYHSNLGVMMQQLGQGQERITSYQRAHALAPYDAAVMTNLGSALLEAGRLEEATDILRRAVEIEPDKAEAWANLGLTLHQRKQFGEALPALIRAYMAYPEFGPRLAIPINECGNAMLAANDTDKAAWAYETMRRIMPEDMTVYVNLGALAHQNGQTDKALDYQAQAMALARDRYVLWMNRGATLTYSTSNHPVRIKEHFAELERELGQPRMPSPRPGRDLRPDRPLRIGYVSPDFRRHAVAYFALPLLKKHSADFIPYCYYSNDLQDNWTGMFKDVAKGGWVDCQGMSDEALAERIRADGIDILVDLAGHTVKNRVMMFTRRPAPLQLTWMGYVTTTGLSAMDYRVTHVDADPPGVEAEYSERLIRLPGTMWCYEPLSDMPPVAPSPFQRKGHITFGAFNRYSKANEHVVAAWGRILAAVPGSRLYICIPPGTARDRLVLSMRQHGVAPERLTCYGKIPHEHFWNMHGEIDIALDPFPFAGGTTSCETLWMGVPIVSCQGTDVPVSDAGRIVPDSFPSRFSSRMSNAFLKQVGLGDLVTRTISGYVDTAVALANDKERLVALRGSLRERMAAAPLTDTKRFAIEMEAAYRQIWADWCENGTE